MSNRYRYFPFRGIPAFAALPLIAAVVVLSSLFGCGGHSSSISPSPTPTPTGTPIVSLSGVLAVGSTHDTDGVETQIYTMNADGSNIKRLSNIAASESPGGWSPNGGAYIVFSSNRNNSGGLTNNSDIYVMNNDGSNVRRVSSDTTKNSITPAWSPDGVNIAFSYGGSIAVLPAASVAVKPATNNILTDATITNAAGPVWSPDETKIAFVADTPGIASSDGAKAKSIFVMNADGTARQQITAGLEYIHQVAWSPDGTKLVFDSSFDTGGPTSLRTQIYTIATDGTNRVRLTNNTAMDLSPAWSPDGKLVMFASNRDHGGGGGGANPYDLYVVDPSTLVVTRVTASGLNFFLGAEDWRSN
jgi:Tol biopolymer transport system component